MNLPRAVPLVFQPGSFIFNIQCLIYSLVLLGSRPNHFNLAPLTLSPNCSTLAGSLMCSFLILSILVTSHKNLLYLYFWHFQLSLLSFGRRFCLQNSHESSQERRLRLRQSWHGSKRETRSSLKRTQSVNTKRNRVPFLSVHLSKKWGLVLVKGEYNKKIAYLSSFLQKKKRKRKQHTKLPLPPLKGEHETQMCHQSGQFWDWTVVLPIKGTHTKTETTLHTHIHTNDWFRGNSNTDTENVPPLFMFRNVCPQL